MMEERTTGSIWQGARVRLRAIEPEDWQVYFDWDQDTEQSRTLYFIPFPRSQEATRRWATEEATRRQEGDDRRFVIENEDGDVVGDLTTHDCNRRVGCFDYGVSIRASFRQRGYATEAIRLLLRYYFEELRYQKVTVTVYSFNEPSIQLHQKLGFQQEGRIRRTVFTQGQYYDELVFGLTAEEFAANAAPARDRPV